MPFFSVLAPKSRLGLWLMVAAAGAGGVGLGLAGAYLFESFGGNGAAYDAGRAAFSEYEPPRRRMARFSVKPGTELAEPGLPAAGAVPPSLTATRSDDGVPSPPVSRSTPSRDAVVPETQTQTAALPGRGLAPGAPAPPGPGDAPAWKKHAARVALAPGVARVGIVIDDLGLDRKRTERALRLPAPVTLAFLPYGPRLAAETARARASGHEILVHVPMEPENPAADPGPNALLTQASDNQVRARLDWALARFPGYVGINNHMGSKFTARPEALDVVMAELKSRGLLFLDSRTAHGAVAMERARAAGVPAAMRHVFLDRDPARAAIDAELGRLEALARKQGFAIAIGHPHDATLDALVAWLPTLAAKGLQLAPVSALVVEGDGAAPAP